MENPYPTFAALASYLREAYPRFGYLHVVEPRVAAGDDREITGEESTDFLRLIWQGSNSAENGSLFIRAGGYTPETAMQAAEDSNNVLIAFGRHFIPNVGPIVVVVQNLSGG